MKSSPSLPAPEPRVQPEPVSSSPGRRQKALADALFGSESNKDRPPTPSAAALLSSTVEASRPRTPEATYGSMSSITSPSSVTTLTQAMPSAKSPISPGFNMSSPNVSHVDAVRLAMEVQQRAEAATAALRKSPSIPKIGEPVGMPHHPRKRINPKQISSPTLVSSSTSLDTIPLPSPSITLTHKVSRFRKLTGTLLAKDVPHHAHEQHPSASSPLPHLPSRLSPLSGGQPDQSASRHHGKALSPDPSPPASASPGIKSFISRFRRPRTATESYPATHREKTTTSLAAFSSSSPSYNSLPAIAQAPRSAPALQTFFDQSTADPTRARAGTTSESQAPMQAADSPPVLNDIPVQSDDLAIKQLFAAASDLGLDQKELHNLLARSPSTSSKLARSASVTESRKSHHLPGLREDVADHSPSPPIPMGRPSTDSYSSRPSYDAFRPSMENVPENVPEITLRPAREDAAANPIVRRTIIFPADPRNSTMDFNALMRKQSAARKRRSAGANSTYSNRSIHERVPTPPPHKLVGRFSTDDTPPVPQVPQSIGAQGERLVIPGQLEPSNSAYDSL